MKALAFSFLVLLAACHSPGSAGQHIKPDSSVVTQPVAQTRVAIGRTRGAVQNAATTANAGASASVEVSRHAAEVARVAGQAAEKGLAAKSAEAEALAAQTAQLSAEVDGLKTNLFRVTMQLREAEDAAAAAEASNAEAEKRLQEFDVKVAAQTQELNQREVALAGARAEKELAVEAQHKAEADLRALRWKIAGWIALAVLLMGAGIYFKVLRFGL